MKVWILIIEAFAVYGLVLGSHALRRRVGLSFFYALIGSMTAIMSWVTDAGALVHFGGITFLVGSTVFYTALLLGVFVVYVFDGPHATRIAILTVVGVSSLVPFIALVLHLQIHLASDAALTSVPVPSLRINISSVAATLLDLVFLAVAWEWLHERQRRLPLGLRAFLTLLGVMWLDVLLFNTMAFAGTGEYVSIMSGTFMSRLVVAVFASPILWLYLIWQNRKQGAQIPQRPLLAILQQLSEMRHELVVANEEIKRRKQAEEALRRSETRYRQLVDNASEAILVVRNGLFALYNQQVLNLTGFNDADMRSKSYFDIVDPKHHELTRNSFEQAMLSENQSVSFECQARKKSGDELWLCVNLVRIEWDGLPSALVFLRDITEQRRKQSELLLMASTDPLTGAHNRRRFLEILRQECERSQRYLSALSLLYLDVDHFKKINDSFGHAAGDLALKRVVEICQAQIREVDCLGRLGGEEFAVALPETPLAEALAVAQRLRQAVREGDCVFLGGSCELSVSIGVSEFKELKDENALLDAADRALLKAKRAGRDRVACCDGADQAS